MATVATATVVSAALLFWCVGASQSSGARLVRYAIREEIPVGSFVGNVKRDANLTLRYSGDDLHRLRFHFRHTGSGSGSGQQHHRYFALDERTGDLRTAQAVDREAVCPLAAANDAASCSLALDVSVKPPQYFQIVKVLVEVVDVNDNDPVFPQDRMTLQIAETTLPGALFLVPTAEDADSGPFGVQDYQMVSADGDDDVFRLTVTDQVDGSKDLRLKLVGRLDRESTDRYTVTVVALDGGRPPRTGSLEVEVVVLDANDNGPRFENASWEAVVREDLPPSSTLVRIRATDPDAGPNGIVAYGFADATERAHGDVFGVDPSTGDVFLKASLDYERSEAYQLTVRATDLGSGSLPAFARVSVAVLDVNDNAPRIVVNVLTDSDFAHVRENSGPGTFVAHAAVSDADTGSNGRVDCSIDDDPGSGSRSRSGSRFDLVPIGPTEYKIVTTVTFDREERAYYDVTLTCRDAGDVIALTSAVKIDVRILDENDNRPRIEKDLYEVTMDENNSPGAVVIRISASDDDEGANGALLYALEPLHGTPDGAVVTDLILGKVTARIAFDYEKRSQYEYRIVVSDRGETPLSSTASLILTILDVNDEFPRFDRSVYYLSTGENQPVGTVVGAVNATDLDATDRFRLIEYGFSEADAVFEINSVTGEIRNMRRLDREDSPVHTFVVVASNDPGVKGHGVNGEGQRVETRVNVTVYVEDENDNAPVFVFPSRSAPTASAPGSSRVEIPGGSGVGTLVARLVATDADEGPNARLAYSIGSGNAEALFDIDPATGVIVLAKDLPKTPGGAQVYRLVVVARDGGTPSLMTVGDLDVIANGSVLGSGSGGPSMSAQADAASIFAGSNLLIFIGAGLGFIVVVVCVVLAIVCAARRRRSSRRRGPKAADKYLAACEGHLLQQPQQQQQQQQVKCRSSSPSSGTKASRGCGSVASTMDSNSVRSGGSHHHHHHHHHGCDCHETLTEDETYIDRIPIEWTQQDSGLTAGDNRGPSTLDVLPHSPPQYGGPSRDRCLGLPTRERSCSPHPLCSHHHCSHCCGGGGGGGGGCGGGGGNAHRHQTSKPPCHLHVNPQSPENIPLQAMMMKGRSVVLDQDLESICSGSTWTDSGRGPSEEEDHIRTQMDPIFGRTAPPPLDQGFKDPNRLQVT